MTFQISGCRVLVTGAASGMGLLYAKQAVLEQAASVILWDFDEAALEAATAHLRSLAQEHRIETRLVPMAVNVGDFHAVSAAAERVLRDGVPDVLINNAGIVRGNAYFWETDTETVSEPTLRINTLAPMHLTGAFLPAMIAQAPRPARILTVASAAATVSNPRMSAYAASKWAVYAWSDSLRLELLRADQEQIRVTTFCPSYVSTGMFAGARGMFLTPILSPEKAVSMAWKAMLKGKAVQFAPRSVVLARMLRGILPVRLWDAVANAMGVYRSMDEFTGRERASR